MSSVLLAVHLVAASIWVGGIFVIPVAVRAARTTLDPADCVNYLRALGRLYGVVGSAALLVALVTGALLLREQAWDGTVLAVVLLAAALVVATLIGMAQARSMTRMRARALAIGGHAGQVGLAAAEIRRHAVLANLLRATIALLTLALVALASVLATG